MIDSRTGMLAVVVIAVMVFSLGVIAVLNGMSGVVTVAVSGLTFLAGLILPSPLAKK